MFIFHHRFYFPAHLVRGFTLSDLLGKPWSQVSFLPPPPPVLVYTDVFVIYLRYVVASSRKHRRIAYVDRCNDKSEEREDFESVKLWQKANEKHLLNALIPIDRSGPVDGLTYASVLTMPLYRSRGAFFAPRDREIYVE